VKIEIKNVNRPIAAVDFDDNDAYEWGVYAIRQNAWKAHCTVGKARVSPAVGAAVAIAAPDGRVAVWYGAADLRLDANGNHRAPRTTVTEHEGALAATDSPSVAAYWDRRRTRGGERDVTALALAACRVLHAHVFGYKPSLRDELLAEFVVLTGDRPPTAHLLRASEDELLAASALISAQHSNKVRALLARKGAA